MSTENLPKSDNEQYDPNLEAQDEEVLSGGNNRLMYVLVAVVLALALGYVVLPKGGKGASSGITSVTPSFMLDDAAVTATATTAADSIAADLKGAPTEDTKDSEEKARKAATESTSNRSKASASAILAATSTNEAVAPNVASLSTPEPEPVVVQATPEPQQAAAPASMTMSGKIEDENGRPLVGATVLLKGSSKGTSTDANGNYTLEVPAGNDNSLIYGYGGYDDEVVRIRNSQPVNVTLTPRAKESRRRR
ncbi:carboxypeptidase-like regulatory domain-containing protein [Hymenobacter terrenus]|uniref:carboxypeptidase-like regulatory domain-containing protein n=1 Tax=Hymenobacter terrenus TaxID=1629124 RepID=UPI000619CADA|nr:carboxypeptidase-like regulatory domain-containing protein [Hymenobacter terrenus]